MPFYHEFQLYFYKTFIRTPLTVLYLDYLKAFSFIEHIVLNIRFPVLHLLLEGDFIMANQKDSLSTLFSEEVHGPFVTFLF